ncbi:TauD/TfdA family dioxygenase [Marinobacter sp. BGYM27]|uniref:TauD/TfdA family dioxygenase n=1 Tax=Marinobacter sp. BGYM27 TaxID=2975597 RepID=UPI0021A3B817|nr:TauD/TfdA family dioxygenase [Marinobacter sp. BGYM27]MDG5498197.1 TauD/TfdA family dioxygenase [Marinobacter sp. BGYM27]
MGFASPSNRQIRQWGDTLQLEDGFPLRVSPIADGTSLKALSSDIASLVAECLETSGGILFSGFEDPGIEVFQSFASGFGHPLLSYEFGSTPRSQVTGGGVYTSTEYPAHRSIPLHNEQAYTTDWPMRIWFYCAQAAQSGGETPIADSREIYRRIDPVLRQRFEDKGLRYVRNYGNGLDVDWQQVFNTDDVAKVESYCRNRDIDVLWQPDGSLRTAQRCQATARHPRTRDWVWFNQAHLFHVSALDDEMQEILLETVGEENLPRNVYYGDGSPIEVSALDEVRGVLDDCRIVFPWQTGDVLMLDNMLAAHSRQPFEGARKVVVAMAEGHALNGSHD